MPCCWKNACECNLLVIEILEFNYLKTNYSQLYLLASPLVPELFLLITALLVAYSTHASAIGTPHSVSSIVSSRWQYPAPCDGGG
jgi:hypothetical protein